jgi:hypothetical protein
VAAQSDDFHLWQLLLEMFQIGEACRFIVWHEQDLMIGQVADDLSAQVLDLAHFIFANSTPPRLVHHGLKVDPFMSVAISRQDLIDIGLLHGGDAGHRDAGESGGQGHVHVSALISLRRIDGRKQYFDAGR